LTVFKYTSVIPVSLRPMKKLSILLLVVPFLWSCSTDFDLNADFIETPVVYGLLDASDSTHYIRINRAFLSDDVDALTLAMDAAEIYYGDEMTVTIEQLNGFYEVLSVISLERINGDTLGIEKDTAGIFATMPNILYRFSTELNPDNLYRIRAVNSATGKEVAAVTPIINNFKITRPNEDAITPQYFALSPQGVYQFTFQHAADAATYDLTLRLHYRNAQYFQDGDSIHILNSEEVDWKFAKEYKAIDRNTGESITVEVEGNSFYNFIADVFEPNEDDDFVRIPDSVQFIVEAGGLEIYNYQLYNNSTLGLTEGQATDVYTNVDGGLGLFSTRYQRISKIFPISIQTRDSIGCSTITNGLNFTPDINAINFPFCE
jgi:hypothetical protein